MDDYCWSDHLRDQRVDCRNDRFYRVARTPCRAEDRRHQAPSRFPGQYFAWGHAVIGGRLFGTLCIGAQRSSGGFTRFHSRRTLFAIFTKEKWASESEIGIESVPCRRAMLDCPTARYFFD